MKFYQKTIQDVSHGLAMLKEAASLRSTPVIAHDEARAYPGASCELNASSIQTALIQITGRFCERYASDLISTFASLDPFLTVDASDARDDSWYIGVGIRDNGVDHDAFILSRLESTAKPMHAFAQTEHVYRKLLVIEIIDKAEEGSLLRTVQLKDVTHAAIVIKRKDSI